MSPGTRKTQLKELRLLLKNKKRYDKKFVINAK